MIEAFERHLQATTFARQAEKATTLDEQIKFCQEFLAKNQKALPPINLGGDHYSISKDVATFHCDIINKNVKRLLVSYRLNEYESMFMSEMEKQEHIGSKLRDGLMNSILTSGAIQTDNVKDFSTCSVVYTAKIGVYIP